MEASTNSKTGGKVQRPPIRRLKLTVTKVVQSQSVLGVMGDNHYSPSHLFQPKKTAALLCMPFPVKALLSFLYLSIVFFSSLTLIIHYSVKADGLCGGQSGWRYICGEHCDQRLWGNDGLSRLRIDGSMVASLLLT